MYILSHRRIVYKQAFFVDIWVGPKCLTQWVIIPQSDAGWTVKIAVRTWHMSFKYESK